MNPAQTIKQKTIQVPLDDSSSTVTVRRMYWKAAREFLKMLAQHVGKLGVTDASAMMQKLPEVIASADELATFLILNSTDLKPEQLDALDIVQAATILQHAIELNAGDELKNSFAGIAAALARIMPAIPTMPGAGSTQA